MITLTLPRGISQQMASELQRAGRREIGGILLAEHVGTNRFVVRDITVHRIGTFASFVRPSKRR
jgi:[CysO sulfur-carrier protein]-S-L-cysteine hydrolase